MMPSALYCFPWTSACRTMAEWGVYWQALAAICAIGVGAAGLFKIYRELQRLVEQRETEINDRANAAHLKRIEFFIDQHRRLFDDQDLYSVLCLIDDDDPKLATDATMPDKKRKFLTYLEEIALLVRAEQIEVEVAQYMFGYYVVKTLEGKNFAWGIDTSRKYWGLLYEFATGAKLYMANNPDGPPATMAIRRQRDKKK
jgi:hypothetical protein